VLPTPVKLQAGPLLSVSYPVTCMSNHNLQAGKERKKTALSLTLIAGLYVPECNKLVVVMASLRK